MKKIKSVVIDNSDLTKNKTIRKLYVSGDAGAVFSIYITNNANNYYNFETKAFAATPYRLSQKTISEEGTYNTSITFPTVVSNDKYEVYVYAESHFETSFVDSLSTSLIYKIPNYDTSRNDDGSLTYPCSIYQYLDVTTTLSLLHADTDVVEPSNVTFVKPKNTVFTTSDNIEGDSAVNQVNLDWTITTNSADHTMSIIKQPTQDDFYTTISKTVDGTVLSSTTVVLDDVDSLYPGMKIVRIESNEGDVQTDYTGITFLKLVNKETKTITMSSGQTIGDNTTMIFLGYGIDAARRLYDARLIVKDLAFALGTVTHNDTGNDTDFNVKSQIKTEWNSGTSVDIDSTNGIKAGNTIEMVGLNQALTVSSVTDADTIVVSGTNATTIPVDTDIYFKGSAATGTITGKIEFTKVPREDFTFTLDLNKIITITDAY